jgi:hypothetical protein
VQGQAHLMAFQGAVDATFAVFGIDATYAPAGGDPVTVRVIAGARTRSLASARRAAAHHSVVIKIQGSSTACVGAPSPSPEHIRAKAPPRCRCRVNATTTRPALGAASDAPSLARKP